MTCLHQLSHLFASLRTIRSRWSHTVLLVAAPLHTHTHAHSRKLVFGLFVQLRARCAHRRRYKACGLELAAASSLARRSHCRVTAYSVCVCVHPPAARIMHTHSSALARQQQQQRQFESSERTTKMILQSVSTTPAQTTATTGALRSAARARLALACQAWPRIIVVRCRAARRCFVCAGHALALIVDCARALERIWCCF